MLFCHLLGALTLAATAFAQIFDIGSPSTGQNLAVGNTFTVEVDQPVSQGVFMSVSVVIGLQVCGDATCPPADDDVVLGDILYAGKFSPQRHESSKPPYQNFTFNIASGVPPGSAVVHVAQLYLLGAGPTAQLTTKNVSVTLVSAPVTKRVVSRIMKI